MSGECQLFEVVDIRDRRTHHEGIFATEGVVVLDDAVEISVPAIGEFDIESASWSMASGRSSRSELTVFVQKRGLPR